MRTEFWAEKQQPIWWIWTAKGQIISEWLQKFILKLSDLHSLATYQGLQQEGFLKNYAAICSTDKILIYRKSIKNKKDETQQNEIEGVDG